MSKEKPTPANTTVCEIILKVPTMIHVLWLSILSIFCSSMFPIREQIFVAALDIYEYFVICPLFTLYIHGPSLGQFGFWHGKTESQICAHLTSQSEVMWLNQVEACSELIQKRFNSSIRSIEVLLYFFVLMRVLLLSNRVMWYTFVQRCCPQNHRQLQKEQAYLT